jgi:uncharacterized RDD family membrane protein YckC
MGAIKVPTNFNIELEFEIPEFYRRLLALIIDIILEVIYIRIMAAVLDTMGSGSGTDSQFNSAAIAWILFTPVLLYHVIMELTMNGQSPGKKITGIRVVDERGGKASFSQFIIRWLLRISDLWIIVILVVILDQHGRQDIENVMVTIFGIGFLITDIILVVSSKKGQRIGDILAHTIIIRTSTKSDINETVFQEVADNYVPAFPEIMQLSDRDINAIKSILETARKKGDFHMAENAAEKIKAHLKINTSLSPFDLLETLLKDYNYLSTK